MIRVLYSFPHKIGADRICYTAWHQVNSLAAAGADVLVMPGVLHKSFPEKIRVQPTLAWGKARISYKLFGTLRACTLHDYIVTRRIEKLAHQIDIIHTWPLGALRTLKTATQLGIPTVLERPNAHTRFAYDVVKRECDRLGVTLPSDHEHAYKVDVLRREEEEYRLPDRILCPSEFVMRTFIDEGFPRERLAQHQYGFDENKYYPDANQRRNVNGGLSMLYVGGCAPRKGLHYALESWLRSPAHRKGTFLIAGGFVPGYKEKLSSLLSHPSVTVLGHRNDVPDLMRRSDVLVLPSIEEGSALVTSEARGSGCVLLVSEAAGAVCRHGENALVHAVGDVQTLSEHITLLAEDRALLMKMRDASLRTVHEITWRASGIKLLEIYREVIEASLR
jgi:glycosyltransferase involved in cell wall biosynthesis